MITFLNRKQLLLTYDMSIQTKVRDVLTNNHVEYKINPIKLGYVSARSSEAEYKVYVKKTDYEKAKYLVRDVLNGEGEFIIY